MDQVKIGRFIAELRRQKGLTQEALGEKIGVTNKTISRWETGSYMPDIEMIQLLAQEFQVNINELLAGEHLADADFRQKADENIIAITHSTTFSLSERQAYFKQKWRKDHVSLFVLLGVILMAAIILPLALHRPHLLFCVPLIALVEHVCAYNRMMIYVEKNLYDPLLSNTPDH